MNQEDYNEKLEGIIPLLLTTLSGIFLIGVALLEYYNLTL